MTPLEEQLKEEAERSLSRLREKGLPGTDFGFVISVTPGIYDRAYYDKEKDRVYKIEYFVGVGEGISLEGEKGAYYDNVEKRSLEL